MVERSQVVPVRVAVELSAANVRRLRLDLADEAPAWSAGVGPWLERSEADLNRTAGRLRKLEQVLAAERGEIGA